MIRQLQKIGNSKGVILTSTMLEHLDLGNEIEVTMEEGRIVLTAPKKALRRQTFEEARHATFAQYDEAFQRLADS